VALGELQTTLARAGKQKQAAAAAFAAASAAVLLHLPMPEEMPPAGDFLPLLPPGLRTFALYVQAHYLYLKEEYALSAGMVEGGALAMGAKFYPIPAIYLHLVAVMDYMSLKQTRQVQDHLLAAWAAAALSQAQADCTSNIPNTPLIVATPREQRKSPVPMNTTRVAAG